MSKENKNRVVDYICTVIGNTAAIGAGLSLYNGDMTLVAAISAALFILGLLIAWRCK